MLDIKFILENQERVREAIKNKNVNLDFDHFLALDAERKKLLPEYEELKSLKNDLNDLWAQAKTEEDREPIIKKGKEIKDKLEVVEPRYKAVQKEYAELLLVFPNIPLNDTPIGKDESGNKILRTLGDIREMKFQPKEHWELGEALDLIDIPRAVKVSGSRFAYLKNELVLLEFALLQLSLSFLTNRVKLGEIIKKAGLDIPDTPFIPILPPLMVKTDVLQKMARLEPREERYGLPQDEMYLIGSAEHSLGPIHMDETLLESELPLRYAGFSSAFRREAGTYGKDMKGILRLHQFDKLEMESFTTAEQSLAEHQFFVALQEHLMQLLGLPYQVVLKCTGDMGTPNARAVDIECWLPGQGKYRETHTADLMTDFQARRLDTKVRRSNGQIELVHMNDGTAFAGRAMIAIMENYQEEDGSIVIPEALRLFVGKDSIKPKK